MTTATATTVRVWHFARDDMTLDYGDGRKITPGETITVDCKPVLCESGLHGSESIMDALALAPGNMVCRCDISGEIVRGYDKLVGTERKCLWVVDGFTLLRDFARWCALQVIDGWDAPDVVRKWLETGDESLRSEARSAAHSAADSAARSAARSAACYAACYAARYAAYSAADYAAGSAAHPAACSAAHSVQGRKLEEMVRAAHAEAGGDA